MKKQYSTMIKFTLFGFALLTIIYFGYNAYSFQVGKVDQLIIALDDEAAKNQALREELDLLKLENDKVQTYINQFHLDEMDQSITSNNRKISQMRELISHLSDIEVRHGKILSYTQTDQLALEQKHQCTLSIQSDQHALNKRTWLNYWIVNRCQYHSMNNSHLYS